MDEACLGVTSLFFISDRITRSHESVPIWTVLHAIRYRVPRALRNDRFTSIPSP